MQRQEQGARIALIGLIAMVLAVETVSGVITVQIGGATRLTSLSRQRDRYNCYWDCDLVGCQIARDDDECAYDCEKICRVRYDYAAVGRSGTETDASSDLRPKSADIGPEKAQEAGAAGTGSGDQLPMNELVGGK